jgi:hypothetical protein
MKKFRKNEQGLFICEECEKTFVYKKTLSYHINKIHNNKEYYDKWINEKEEKLCKICGNENIFLNFKKGYKNGCCKKHMNKLAYEKRKENLLRISNIENQFQEKDFKEKSRKTKLRKYGNENYVNLEKNKLTCLKRYGVEYSLQSEKIKEKSRKTKLRKYNNLNYNNSDKTKETCLKKYGESNISKTKIFKEKNKQTCLKKYGVENPYQSEIIKEKCKKTKLKKYNDENYNNPEKNKKTCLEKYGVENPSQNIKIYNKGLKTRFLIHKFRNTNLWYQSSYELDFLEKYYDKYPEIIRGPSIKYFFEGKNKVYYPDFYIPSLNLIIEIKSSWTIKLDKEIIEKEKATISNGFNYIMILDKDYKKIEVNYLATV